MPEIGQLSGSLEKKEYGYEPRSRRYAGPDWGWQTEESYNKIVQQRNRGLVSEAVDFIEEKAGQAFGFISQIPGVKQGLEFVEGVARFVDRTTIQPAIQAAEDPSRAGTPEALIGTVFKAGQMAEQGGAQIVRNLGVDPRIGSAVAGAAYETVTGAAVGKLGRVADALTPPGGGGLTPAMAGAGGPQLTMRGGSVNLQPPTVNKLTVTDPEILSQIPNIKPGIGQSELYKKGLIKLRKLQADGVKKRKLYKDQFETGVINEKQYKSRLAKLKKREDANYSTLGTVEDPDIFEVPSQVQRDPIDPNLPAHQHHAAGKAMTSPWVQQALKLGDDDDVIAFFEFHRALTGSGMGNVKSGIIDMPGFAHIPRDARTPADVPMAVHSFMKKSGADVEIVTTRVEKIIGNPTNMDELMQKYSTFAEEYLIPQKELSLKRLNQVLTQHRQTLSPKQRQTFDELVSKLNKANTQ